MRPQVATDRQVFEHLKALQGILDGKGLEVRAQAQDALDALKSAGSLVDSARLENARAQDLLAQLGDRQKGFDDRLDQIAVRLDSLTELTNTAEAIRKAVQQEADGASAVLKTLGGLLASMGGVEGVRSFEKAILEAAGNVKNAASQVETARSEISGQLVEAANQANDVSALVSQALESARNLQEGQIPYQTACQELGDRLERQLRRTRVLSWVLGVLCLVQMGWIGAVAFGVFAVHP